MQYTDTCVVIFAREPVPGETKTRLIPALGKEGACRLYLQLLHRQLEVFNKGDLCASCLCVSGSVEHEAFSGFCGEKFQQQSGDLGQRMRYALDYVLAKYPHAIIIGTDCPGINSAYLEAAITQLQTGREVVIGPAEDGGYVLLGLSRMVEGLFTGINWGSSLVLEQSRNVLRREGIDWFELPVKYDIDIPPDLEKLPDYLKSDTDTIE